MAENDSPPAPAPVGAGTPASAPTPAPLPAPAADAPPAPELELEPTIRDHAERARLQPWQVAAIVARLHGLHDDDGVRVFSDGVSLSTRMSAAAFDEAAHVALHGRI